MDSFYRMLKVDQNHRTTNFSNNLRFSANNLVNKLKRENLKDAKSAIS